MKRWRIEIICGTAIGAVWAGYALLENWISHRMAARFGEAILRAALGNVSDAAGFVRNRLGEAVWLFSAALLAVMLHALLARIFLKPGSSRNARWAAQAVAGFVLLNAWLAVACHTTLGWCALWQGRTDTHNLVRFQIKHRLLCESAAPRKAAILGSSQARAQLEEQLLNDLVTPSLHVGELHFPGSRAYDILLVHRKIEAAAAQMILCYVSEMNFYSGSSVETVPLFFGFEDLPDRSRLGMSSYIPAGKLGYGLLSEALPAFYLRDALSQRILGLGLSGIRQRQHDVTVKVDLEASAGNWARSFHLNAESDFQKKSFAEFAAACARRNQQLVIIAGQLNPLVGQRLDPACRTDMLAFLRGLRDRHPNVLLIDDAPFQEASDYGDLTHIGEARQRVFTQFVAQRLLTTALGAGASVSPGSR